MSDKQEYVEETAATSINSSSATNVAVSVLEAPQLDLSHESKEQAALDIEMAKARKTEPPSRRWIVLATATLGALFVSLQGSALIVALPDLMQHLNISFAIIIWVLLTYTLAITAIVPLLGNLGDAGLKGIRCRMFNWGFLVFTIGSLLCGLSQQKHSGFDLLAFRIIQGLGGALLFSNCFAVVADKFYPYNQVGLASGIINIAFAAGTILGPVVVQYASFSKLVKTFDYTGFITLTTSIALLFVVVVSALFDNGKVSEEGTLIGMGVAFGVLFIIFLGQEMFVRGGKRFNAAKAPFMDFRLFKNMVFNNTVVLGGLAGGVARTNLTFSFIFFFQGPYAKDPLMAGILLIPFGLGIMLAGFPSGRLADTLGFRLLCFVGLAIATISTLIMPLAIKPDTNTWVISFLLLLNGIGWGLYSSPSASISMLCILPQQRSSSSSMRIMFTMLSQMIAIVICFKVIINGMPPAAVQQLFIYGGGMEPQYLESFMNGWKVVQWITMAITLFCCICAWFLPVRPVMATAAPESTDASTEAVNETK
ncbi:hypothetical protein BG000_001410 [Podila horticola]|nr:hypothetical protein BG000_001410 [Podila horticola]